MSEGLDAAERARSLILQRVVRTGPFLLKISMSEWIVIIALVLGVVLAVTGHM